MSHRRTPSPAAPVALALTAALLVTAGTTPRARVAHGHHPPIPDAPTHREGAAPASAAAARSPASTPRPPAAGLRGAAARRQRRRRRGRDGRDARRHRALLHRHRRRRLLRLLRREDRPGAHHRRPRDRAGVDAARRVHRPGDRRALQLHPRAGHQRRLRRRARHAGRPGSARSTAGARRRLGQRAAARRSTSRGAASWSTRRSASRPRRTRPAFDAVHVDPQALPPAAATRPRSARSSATPTSPAPTGCSRAGASAPSTAGRSAARSCTTVQHPPKTAATDAAGPARAPCSGATSRRTARSTGSRRTCGYRGLRRLRHGAVVVRRLDRRRGAEHPRAAPTCRR